MSESLFFYAFIHGVVIVCCFIFWLTGNKNNAVAIITNAGWVLLFVDALASPGFNQLAYAWQLQAATKDASLAEAAAVMENAATLISGLLFFLLIAYTLVGYRYLKPKK